MESMGGYRVGPEGAMVGGGYDAALGRPLGSLAGGMTLENQGDKIYCFDESSEKVSAKPESLGRR
jgi:hypothetical protein